MIIFVSIVVGIISFSLGFVLGGLWNLDGTNRTEHRVVIMPTELDCQGTDWGKEGEDEWHYDHG